jgi:hypothetical protein
MKNDTVLSNIEPDDKVEIAFGNRFIEIKTDVIYVDPVSQKIDLCHAP